jgi:hypothetical protein
MLFATRFLPLSSSSSSSSGAAVELFANLAGLLIDSSVEIEQQQAANSGGEQTEKKQSKNLQLDGEFDEINEYN